MRCAQAYAAPTLALHDGALVYPRRTAGVHAELWRAFDLSCALPAARFPRFHAALKATATSARLRAREVVLAPGDTLYIPPYTWHRASVAGTASAFSVAVYSQSTPMDAYPILKNHPIPISPTGASRPRPQAHHETSPSPDTIAQLLSYCVALAALRWRSRECARLRAAPTADGDASLRRVHAWGVVSILIYPVLSLRLGASRTRWTCDRVVGRATCGRSPCR